MLRAALSEVPSSPVAAVCVAPEPVTGLPPFAEVLLGGHPVPDDGSVAAGNRALALAAACAESDTFVVLLSGGASALLAAPAAGVSLEHKRATTKRLLRSGADIHAINTVRKHLSLVKGGRLAAATRASTICLAISDVVGDDLSVIASGPTVADETTFVDALAVLDAHGGRDAYPRGVVEWLEQGRSTGAGESPKPGAPVLERAQTFVIASRADALCGARDEAVRRGYATTVLDVPVVGEARDAAAAHAAHVLRETTATAAPVCLLSGGETTVTVTGTGVGGRNQEFALACLRWLSRLERGVVVVSLGTDGIDGPTDAAGAVVDTTSLAGAAAIGVGAPEPFLADNASYRYLDALGALVRTGATGTNVGDIQVVVAGAGPT